MVKGVYEGNKTTMAVPQEAGNNQENPTGEAVEKSMVHVIPQIDLHEQHNDPGSPLSENVII